jgi:hypothetical protein
MSWEDRFVPALPDHQDQWHVQNTKCNVFKNMSEFNIKGAV